MKVKIFDIKTKTDASEINTWLKANQNLDIISTNALANEFGWGYIILYRPSELDGDDTDED